MCAEINPRPWPSTRYQMTWVMTHNAEQIEATPAPHRGRPPLRALIIALSGGPPPRAREHRRLTTRRTAGSGGAIQCRGDDCGNGFRERQKKRYGAD
ncbi:hypothetical protein EVAR_61396_1 [Eumeta japonica]|uniref:Uncharacterized protein n=1 Tax=Eumeta variegata TaxID=151549 RepID=A0A4C1Z5U6_EUMVA|nr:hypothetical protein EVAR_61396_1 [Eumeta japonica]